MNSKIMSIFLIVSAVVFTISIYAVNGQTEACHGGRCYGGPHDKCFRCGTRCPPTCSNPNPGRCTKDCAINVCECEPGYFRAQNGWCLLLKDCPRRPLPEGNN